MAKTIVEFEKIKELAGRIYDTLKPCKVYLFGSFANGTQDEDSDYDFYVVVEDNVKDTFDCAAEAHYAICKIPRRPVDIVVERNSKFESLKSLGCAIENTVAQEGILIYE